MNDLLFDWDEGNTKHVVYDHPERGNTQEEVESLFYDPFFRPTPDRTGKYGEQEFSGVAIGTEGIEKHVVFVVRNGKIRPITCRRATRKQRVAYHEIVSKEPGTQERKDD
jgi:uncharacterized DUF497 family protein